jgi:protein-S-isoprenylcysteine O-methyltransferase Ste14
VRPSREGKNRPQEASFGSLRRKFECGGGRQTRAMPRRILMEKCMNTDAVFRIGILFSGVVIGVIRVYFHLKISRDTSKFSFQEGAVSLAFGGTAAIVNIVFGVEYIFSPGTFGFAYALPFPEIIRWIGMAMPALGIIVLGTAHYHLNLSFSSFVGSKEGHKLVQSGPYRLVRHPIYLAYLLAYLGGGLVAGNWALTFIPVTCFAVAVCIRMPQEERILADLFGEQYTAYMRRTGRLLPRIRPGAG